MRVGLTLRPGQRGTRRLLAEFGDRLVCVRYRYDPERRRRVKTVELIVAEVPWQPRSPRPDPPQIVGLRILWGEVDLARRVRRAGGLWRRDLRLWQIPYDAARALGVEDRIVVSFPKGSITRSGIPSAARASSAGGPPPRTPARNP